MTLIFKRSRYALYGYYSRLTYIFPFMELRRANNTNFHSLIPIRRRINGSRYLRTCAAWKTWYLKNRIARYQRRGDNTRGEFNFHITGMRAYPSISSGFESDIFPKRAVVHSGAILKGPFVKCNVYRKTRSPRVSETSLHYRASIAVSLSWRRDNYSILGSC